MKNIKWFVTKSPANSDTQEVISQHNSYEEAEQEAQRLHNEMIDQMEQAGTEFQHSFFGVKSEIHVTRSYNGQVIAEWTEAPRNSIWK